MSRPPITPEQTAAGIALDPHTLERVIPESRRPDGTYVTIRISLIPPFIPPLLQPSEATKSPTRLYTPGGCQALSWNETGTDGRSCLAKRSYHWMGATPDINSRVGIKWHKAFEQECQEEREAEREARERQGRSSR
jgi:hypothetical protein